MSLQNYKSTRGTTNLARVARMILGPCTGVLCALLKKEVTPSALMHNVTTFIANYPKGRHCPINKDQEQLVSGGNFSEFDITLLYTLLRNVSAIQPHSNNWGNDPEPGDRSVSANIERIRLIRNQYGHSSDTSLTDTAFNKKCQDILTIIQELEGYLGADTIYQDAVAHIKTCSMDPEQEAKYINQLHDVNNKLDYVLEEVQKTQNTSVPHSVRALYEMDISKWKEDDRVFFETHNFPVMLDQVRKYPYVTFIGVPGSGKTATARHIALLLQGEGYDILPIVDKNKIEDYCNSAIPQVFVIDDVIGVFGLNEVELHMINKYSERLKHPINPKTKILMTCREAVFRNEKLSDSVLVRNENVVFLQSKANALTNEDKQNLLEKYNLDKQILTADSLASSSNMFPVLCKLFSSKKELKVYGPTFFVSPVSCILKEMNSLKKQNKLQYASLVLLMANKNKLSEKMLDNEKDGTKEKKRYKMFREMKNIILDKCKVPSTTDGFQFIGALLEMEGTYTRKSDNKFTFIHDSMFEIIAYHFGRQFPELILQYASSNYIANYIKVEKDNSHKRKRKTESEEDKACTDNKLIEKNNESETIIDLCIHLDKSQYPLLVERLFKDLQNGELYNVFGNNALKRPPVLQKFIETLEEKSYDDLYSLLLSELKNSSKICKWKFKKEEMVVKDEKYMHMRYHAHNCLINVRYIDSCFRRSARGIAWVISFGHHQILQTLLNRMLKAKGNVDDLFQNCFNKLYQTSSNTNQNNPGNDQNHKDSYTNTDKDSDSDAESDATGDILVDTANNTVIIEPMIIEQCRLLCLGCYSGDLTTVQMLLKLVNIKVLNFKDWPSTAVYSLETNPLIIACKYGYLDIVTELLEAKADINICVGIYTPLIAACENEQISIVRVLSKSNACVNKSSCGCTPLRTVCAKGNINLVEELIKDGADVNLYVPLINACINDHLSIVEKLIIAGADVNLHEHGKSPLIVACEQGHFNVVKILINSGADVNIVIKEKTPLIAACDSGHFNVLKWLMKSGAQVDPREKDKTILNFPCYWDHLNIVKRLIEMESFFDRNDTSEISFIDACYRGHLDVVKEMIKGGANVKQRYKDKTPLITACYKAHLHVVKELIKAGADVNVGNEFISPLQVASYMGHLSIVKELSKGEYDGNQIYSVGKALVGATFFGHLSVVKELIACHVDVNLKYGKETPLTTACYMGHLNICKELLEVGADFNGNNESITPLTLACYRGHINIVRELIKQGANVNQSDTNITPLITACEGGQEDGVVELIKAGANVNQSDGNKTPLTAACGLGHCFIVEELIKAHADVNKSDGKNTPLTAACNGNYMAKFVVEKLIKAGADVNQSDGHNTPLIAACVTTKMTGIQCLIIAGADVNQSDGNKTPLTAAVEIENMEVIQCLIIAGADVNQSDGNKTPLTAACEKENMKVIQCLIIAGADVNQSDGNKAPLTAACEGNHWDVVNKLKK